MNNFFRCPVFYFFKSLKELISGEPHRTRPTPHTWTSSFPGDLLTTVTLYDIFYHIILFTYFFTKISVSFRTLNHHNPDIKVYLVKKQENKFLSSNKSNFNLYFSKKPIINRKI